MDLSEMQSILLIASNAGNLEDLNFSIKSLSAAETGLPASTTKRQASTPATESVMDFTI